MKGGDRGAGFVVGIETSCDDTACAVLDGQGTVLSSVVSSQLVHEQYGGVVPEIASRQHLLNWPTVEEGAFSQAGITWADVSAVAATRGPGLLGSLLVGLSLGRAAAWARGLSFHAVHHLEGHLLSPFLRETGPSEPPPNRFFGLVVSGGHTALYRVEGTAVETLGETRDDAMGECFDKVGKRLGLGFPAGPEVDRLAESGNADEHPFKVGRCGDTLDFSYSGLKTQALVDIERLEAAGSLRGRGREAITSSTEALALLAGFREAAVGQLLERLERLSRRQRIRRLAVSGGAAANALLRRRVKAWAKRRGVELFLVPLVWSGDNAAMIAWAALQRQRHGFADDPRLGNAASRLPLAHLGES